MISVNYEIQHPEYNGDTIRDIENLKTEDSGTWWEAKTEVATLLLSFPETKIHEIRLGILSSIEFTIYGAAEFDLTDNVLLIEKKEYAVAAGVKSGKYRNADVSDRKHPGFQFTRLQLNLKNIEPKKPMKIAYIGLYAEGQHIEHPDESVSHSYSLKRNRDNSPLRITTKKTKTTSLARSPSPKHTVKIPASRPPMPSHPEVQIQIQNCPDLATTDSIPASKPSAPPTKPLSRWPRRVPMVSTEPAECSYASLLCDCVVTCLEESEHVQRLCECMGACYLDHLEEFTTHVVLGSDLQCDRTLDKTKARLVTVAWLEKCLDARTRQIEDEFEVL